MTTQERLDHERRVFLANRKGAGRARSSIKRKVVAVVADGAGRVQGGGILIRPNRFNRDQFRAFTRFCERVGVSLKTVEEGENGRTLCWLAVGSADGLREVTRHDYMQSGQWEFQIAVK